MRRRLALAGVVVALAGVAAGCGGDDESGESATAAWAGDLCTAVTDWTDEIENVLSQFSDPSNLSQEGIESAAEDARSATDEFLDDIESLGAPETESGEDVQSALDSLSTTIESESDDIEQTVAGISNVTELPSAIPDITASLSAMGTALSTTLTTVQDADVQGEVRAALADSPECAGIPSD